MKNLKSKFMMPAFAIVFAIVSAFATNATHQENIAAPVQGYINNSVECIPSDMCSNIPGPICTTVEGTQLFGLNANGTDCTQVLYQPQQ